MVSNEHLGSKLDDVARTPTADDLGYKDSDLSSILSTQQGYIEFRPENSPASEERWLRTTTADVVFTIEEWC